jgi:uncharacterized membrane protein YkvA (DUF1232 family)
VEFSGTHNLLGYSDDIKLLRYNINIIKKNTYKLLVANKEADVETNTDKHNLLISELSHSVMVGY